MLRGVSVTDKIEIIASEFGNHMDPIRFMDNDGDRYLSDRAIKFISKMGGIMEVHKLIEKRGA